ncbi:MAG: hypothetical protein R3F48_02655 [Candidatus Zixiibacteriota bacterium]
MKTIILLCLVLPTLALGAVICGDANGDGNLNVADVVFAVNFVFKGGPSPDPLCSGDSNHDDTVNLADAVYLVNYIFRGGPPPIEPCCPVPDSTPYEILFIGSSYFTYNNLPGLVRELATEMGKTFTIHEHTMNGLYLADHAVLTSTEDKINERAWDYIVLQGVGRLMAYPDSFPDDHPVYPALVTLKSKIMANCEDTKIIFQMPWAYEDGMIWLSGWTDEYPQMQQKIYDNTLDYSDSIGFIISPVGWAWNTVLYEQSYPLHYLHLSDWNHPSLRGSYLMACTIYSTIFKESIVGASYSAGLPSGEVSYFQSVGSNMVLDSLEVWKIE